MKTLVTSSSGLSGKSVVHALNSEGISVRAMLHSAGRADEMLSVGASETVIADIASFTDILSAMQGMDAVYYIAPTARQDEAEIGKMAIKAANEAGIKRFIYQSVLHAIESELPHHRQKLEVERTLLDSGLNYTIVQPAPFMQNLLNGKDLLINQRIFAQKFFTEIDSANRLNLIDACDFGRCVAEIVKGNQFDYSTLELCGPQNLSVREMLSDIEKVMGNKVQLRYITDTDLIKSLTEKGATEYYRDTLLRMFRHYNSGDFCGSPFTASAILNRTPTAFIEFLKRDLK